MLEDNWSKKSASASSVNFEVVVVAAAAAVAAVAVVVDLVSPPSESDSESLELEESELEELELDESLLGGSVSDASSFSCSFWSFKAAICAARAVALESKNPNITQFYVACVQSFPWVFNGRLQNPSHCGTFTR